MTSKTTVSLLGEGLKSHTSTNYETKWGVFSLSPLQTSTVKDYTYTTQNWLGFEKGNQQLQCYAYEASNFNKKDDVLTDGQSY